MTISFHNKCLVCGKKLWNDFETTGIDLCAGHHNVHAIAGLIRVDYGGELEKAKQTIFEKSFEIAALKRDVKRYIAAFEQEAKERDEARKWAQHFYDKWKTAERWRGTWYHLCRKLQDRLTLRSPFRDDNK